MARSKMKLSLLAFALFLIVAAMATLIATKNDKANATAHHPVIKSSCSSTLYPELCLSSLSAAPAAALSSLKSTNDVIKLSLNLTINQVEHNYFIINKLIAARNVSLMKREVSLTKREVSPTKREVSLTKRERTSLHDCLEMVDDTLDELRKTLREVQNYRSNNNNKSLARHACDLKILLSAAMTNQKTCLDGFSHDRVDKKFREKLTKCQTRVFHMCSNALAMVKNMTDSAMASEEIVDDHYHHDTERRLDEKSKNEWPEWLSAGDRRLLQATTVVPDVIVAKDGSGNFQTVAAAVAAAPEGSSKRYIIRIKAGVYEENVEVPKKKINLMFVGDGRTTTIITGSRNVVDGSTTFNSATVAVVGDRFLARDITFQNRAGPSKHQAVALRVNADFTAFYRCAMLAYQDTLYVHSLRQFYVSCFIAGTVDFIFGNAAVVLQNCDIHARRPDPNQKNMVTAQGRDDPNQNTGIVIQKCRIGATSDLQAVQGSFQTYLGRPWKMYSRTVVMQSDISDVINPAGWFEWDGNFALDTLFYAEYQNSGAGAGTANRVKWKGYRVLTSAAEAQPFTAGNFIVGGSWLGSTGFPFSLGL